MSSVVSRRRRTSGVPVTHAIVALFVGMLTAAVTLPATPAEAFPTPRPVPSSWQLGFRAGDLRLYVDPQGGGSYWYFTYVVTNRTGRDQLWAPSLVLFSDTGEIISSGDGVPSRVEESLRELLGNPLLMTQNEVIGDLFQGEEHAKDGLAVWPAENRDVNEMSLFVGGISGETARVRNPMTGQPVILRKTLHRSYIARGDAFARGSKPVEVTDEVWVMR